MITTLSTINQIIIHTNETKIHMKKKCKQLGLKLRKIYWLLCRHSNLSMRNKLLLYTHTQLVNLWYSTLEMHKEKHIKVIQMFQNIVLCSIVNMPCVCHILLCYIHNEDIHQYLWSYQKVCWQTSKRLQGIVMNGCHNCMITVSE